MIPTANGSGVERFVVRRRFFEEFRVGGKPLQDGENRARGKPGSPQFSVGRGELALVPCVPSGDDGGHAAFDVSSDHLQLVFPLESLCDGLFGEPGDDAPSAQIVKDSRPPEPFVLHAIRGVHLSEALVIEVADVFEPGDDGVYISEAGRTLAQFEAQFV